MAQINHEHYSNYSTGTFSIQNCKNMHANRNEYINRNNKVAIFLCIHKSVTFYPKITKFAVKLPAYEGRLDFKLEVNRARRFRDMRDQSFSFCSSFFFLLRLFA